MAATGVAGRESPVPWFQRMLDSIPFLVLLGVLFPTGLYTVWSVIELRDLPHFSEAPNGALHGTMAPAVAAPHPPVPVPEGAVVSMKDLKFNPKVLDVTAGTTVTWVNEDPYDHAVASGTPETPADDLLFEGSGDFPQGGSFAHTFESPGTYEIYCSTPGHYASGMTMTVVVTEASR